MGGGGGNQRPSGGLTWDGGNPGNVSPDKFNRQILGDIVTSYGQGPTYQGLGAETQQGLRGLLGVSREANAGQGYMRPATNFAQGLISGAGNPSLTERTLMNVAQGGEFGTQAPGYARVRQGVADDTLTGVNSLFANQGRFGGGAHVSRATESLADSLAGLDYANYQNDIARQERALGAIEGRRQQGVGNAMAGAAALPGMFQASLLPSQTIAGVGNVYDQNAQAQADASYNHLAQYLGLLQSQNAGPQDESPGPLDWIGTLGSIGVGLL